MLISGAAKRIDVADLKKYTKYIGGYDSSSSVVKWFWKFVEKDMTDHDHSKLLMFVTSCPRSPLLGFESLQPQFTISKIEGVGSNDKLPTSATCFNLLKLPEYSSEKVLRDKLMYAIHANAGFEMV